jgi:hypothetical protein
METAVLNRKCSARQPGALTTAMVNSSHSRPFRSSCHSLSLFNHLHGQLCCYPSPLTLEKAPALLLNMAPNKLAVVVALVASLLVLLSNSNTKVTNQPTSWRVSCRLREWFPPLEFWALLVCFIITGCSGCLPAGSCAPRPSAAPDRRPGQR